MLIFSWAPPPCDVGGEAASPSLKRQILQPAREHEAENKAPRASGTKPIRPPLFPWPLAIFLATSLAVVLPFFFLGIPSGHDFEFHLNSWMDVLSQWKMGILYPCWADLAHYGYGEARFVFYPPTSWMLGSALGAVLPWKLVPGAYVVVVLTLAGCSMFLLARRWLDYREAIFTAAFYAANPYHLVIVYWRSAFAELLAAVWLPLFLLCVLRLDEEGRKGIVPLGLLIGAVWLTNAPSAVMVNYALAFLVVLMALTRRSPRLLLYGALAAILGAALAAFYVLPATYEQRWVDISRVLAEGVRPQDNFLFTNIADPRHNRFNYLVSTLALAEMGALAIAAFWWRRWRKQIPQAWWMVAAGAAVAALLMFSPTLPAWEYLPKLRFMQLPWRWLLCFNLAFVLLIAVAWRHWLARFAVLVAMLAVLAFGWHRFQSPWWDTAVEIAKLEQSIQTASGYEGTDEYIPVDSDAYEIDHAARRVTFEGNGTDQIRILHWGPESKSFTANVSQPGELVLRLFNYPAWRVEVNGSAVEADERDVTGQLMVPVSAGENRVSITFTQTRDRRAGEIVSLMAALGTLVWWGASRKRPNIAQAPSAQKIERLSA